MWNSCFWKYRLHIFDWKIDIISRVENSRLLPQPTGLYRKEMEEKVKQNGQQLNRLN